jgi:hypothetical protein
MVRRVITGNNEHGRSYVAAEDMTSDRSIWGSIEGDPLGDSSGGGPTPLLPSTAPHVEPPRGGSRVLRVTVQPSNGSKGDAQPGGKPRLDPKIFHRTATVDYIMIVSGELVLLLDEGEATLRAGDLLIQRNTNHAWENRGDEIVDFWGVMVALTPA